MLTEKQQARCIGRDELEACGEAFLAQVRQQAEKLVREMAA
ncbi:TPA: hypothetical protein ACWZ8M_004349 [Escherichia coli]